MAIIISIIFIIFSSLYSFWFKLYLFHENDIHNINIVYKSEQDLIIDIQLLLTVFIGYARRNCWCDDSGQCSWTKPNFAKCQSIFLINIYDEVCMLCNF